MTGKLVEEKLNKNGPKHGNRNQKAQKNIKRGGKTTGEKRVKEAQGTKGNSQQKAARNTKKGKSIYIRKIYIEKRKYVDMYQRVIFNVRYVAYLLGNLNERFLQKQKEG